MKCIYSRGIETNGSLVDGAYVCLVLVYVIHRLH
jgi:hypothetical protein